MTTIPLDIDIDMTDEFWEGTEEGTMEECAQQTCDALAFIVSHGSITSRWRTVSICTDLFYAHLAVIRFLGAAEMPKLRSLELIFNGPNKIDELDKEAFEDNQLLDPSLLLQNSSSQLDTLKLQGVPNAFLFGHPDHPQFSNLTHLELELVLCYPSLHDLNLLLAANSQLVVLCLNMGSANEYLLPLNRDIPRIHLPQLKELLLLYISSLLWVLDLVKMLHTPNVDNLQVNFSECDEEHNQLLQYIAKGGSKATPEPLFPSLTRLTFGFNLDYDYAKALRVLLAAYPQITFLDTLWLPAKMLKQWPWLVPNLSHLRVVCP